MFKNNNAFSGFSVNDIKRAKGFYGGTLGMDVSDIPGMEGLLNITIANGNKVVIYSKPNHEPATFTVLNFPVENIEKAVEELKKRGVTFESYDMENLKTDEKNIARGKPSVAWFKDPAGNILSVIEGIE